MGDDRVEVGIVEKLGGYIEPYNKRDMTIGGSTVGAFGDGSGGVPEVRVCLSSEGTKDDECATWAYQWETGSVVGSVKRGSDHVSGHRIFIEPVTDEHGADTTSTRSSTRDYEIDGLRDGVYNITAYSTSTNRISGDSVHEVVFYHDEKTDDKDTLTKYVGTAAQDTANWTVQRLGLKLMGYIGNDVNRDSKFRGDESVAGISVTVSGTGVRETITTNQRGFYEFDDLPDQRYTISVSQGSYEIARAYTGTAKTRQSSWRFVRAQDYPSSSFLEEGDFRLPYWSSYTSRFLRNSSVTVCDDRDPPYRKCGTLYNFGLLYKDGEIEGGVNNLSGSASGIDLIFTDVFTKGEQEVKTNFRGEFTRTRLTEGDFTVKIEDAGWAVPKMRFGKPDDDGTTLAPTTVRASLRGKDDFENMPILHVYDAGASSGDFANASVKVSGRTQGTTAANFDSAVSWPTGWKRASGSEKTEGGNIGTISWKSASVSFSFGFRNSYLSRDASVEVKKGSTVCRGHRCVLDYNRTGSRDSTKVRENTLTVMVTAENGYDDHEYTLKVGRAAPIGREMTKEHFRRVDRVDGKDVETPAIGDGDGKSVSRAFTMETKAASGRSLTMRIDLEMLGEAGESNAYCAQSAMVQEYNDADTLKSLNPEPEDGENDPYEDDVCRDTRYSLGVGKLYEIEIKTEDSVAATYYLNTRNRDKGGDGALRSLEVEGTAVTLKHPRGHADTAFMNVVETADTVTVEWETTDDNAFVTASPRDTDSGEDGHQFVVKKAPNAVDTLAIRVVSEDKSDTAHYGLVVQRANNVATLKSLSADVGLKEKFDPATTSYTADAAHDDGDVVFTFAPTDSDASTKPTSPHTATLGEAGTKTTVSIVATAEDASTSKTYSVTVTRAPTPPDAVPAILFVQGDGDDVVEVTAVTVGEGDTLIYGVKLEKEPTAEVQVTLPTYAAADFTRASGVSSPFTFTTTNFGTPQYDTLVSVEDDDGADDEVNGVFVTDNDNSPDDYDDVEATIAITTTDDETPGITMDPLGIAFVEGATTLNTYRIELDTRPTRTVIITPETDDLPDGVTVSPAEWVVSTTGTGWDDGRVFTIASNDDDDEDNEDIAFDLSHSVASTGDDYRGETVGNLNAVIHATEEASVIISVTKKVMDEGTEFTYSVSLSMDPDANETVTVTINCKTSDFTSGCKQGGNPVELTFTDTSAQEITLTANHVSPDHDVEVRHSVSTVDTDDGEDGNYEDVTTASTIRVKIVDADGS